MTQITDQAAAECAAIIKRLAERGIKCPNQDSHSETLSWSDLTDYTTRKSEIHCSTCGGTGKVAGFPWLRQPCYGKPLLDWDGINSSPRHFHQGFGWADDCPGWVPRLDIPIEEALAAMSLQRLLILWEWRQHIPLEPDAGAADIRLAFWQAVEKAVGNA